MTKIERESINFKLPKTLTNALRVKAHELNTTATDLVIQGLNHVLSEAYDSTTSTESSIETRLDQLETQLNYLESRIDMRVEPSVDDSSKQRLEALEQKLEAMALRLAQTEGALALLGSRQQTSPRRQAFTYHPPQVKLQPYNRENLAKRLGIDVATLERSLQTLSPKDFDSWCRSKDPGSMAWHLNTSDGLYHPVTVRSLIFEGKKN